MPQLEVSTYISQIFWLIVCFSVLYYLLSKESAAAGRRGSGGACRSCALGSR